MLDIKNLIGTPAISEEEKASAVLINGQGKNVTIFILNSPEPNGNIRSTYEQLVPVVEQVISDLKADALTLNDYALRCLKNVSDDIDKYVMVENTNPSSRGLCVIGTIEKWDNITYTPETGKVTYLLTLNFSQINDISDKKLFSIENTNTLNIQRIPLTAYGIIDDIGGYTNLHTVFTRMGARAS